MEKFSVHLTMRVLDRASTHHRITADQPDERAPVDKMELQRGLWQHSPVIEFRTLADDHPDLAHSPLLRGALLTLQYAQEHGSIGLT
ncbi:MAG: hypothetical protein WEB57_14945 [Pseudohongiellaceae bacterium]